MLTPPASVPGSGSGKMSFWNRIRKLCYFWPRNRQAYLRPQLYRHRPLIAQQCNKERVVEGKGKAICHLTAIGNGSGPRDLWAILFQYGSPEICFLAICIACHKFAFAFAFAVLSTISQPILHNRFVFFSEGHEMFRVLNGKCKARPAEGQ